MSEHEHTFANPSPTGLAALAMACMCLWAVFTGRTDAGAAPVLAFWFIGGGIIQVSVGIMELRNGVFKSGNVMLLFGAFFMFVGAAGMLGKYLLVQNGLPIDPRIEGYAWLVCALVLIGWTPGYFKNTPLALTAIVLLVDIALIIIAFVDMAVMPKPYIAIAGWLLLVTSLLAIYLSAALFVNTALGKNLLPIKML